MKKISLILILLTFVAYTPTMASADNENRESIRDRIRQLNQERVRENIEDKRENWQNMLQKLRSSSFNERMQHRKEAGELLRQRFNYPIERLQNIHDRMLNRAKYLEDEGVEVEEIKDTLAKAQTQIDEAKEKAQDIKDILESEITEENRLEKKEEIKTIFESLKEDVREAHNYLKEAFELFKSLRSTSDEDDNETFSEEEN